MRIWHRKSLGIKNNITGDMDTLYIQITKNPTDRKRFVGFFIAKYSILKALFTKIEEIAADRHKTSALPFGDRGIKLFGDLKYHFFAVFGQKEDLKSHFI